MSSVTHRESGTATHWKFLKRRNPGDWIYQLATILLYLAIISLLVLTAVAILWDTSGLLRQHKEGLAIAVPQVLGGIVLAIIILELAETVHEQMSGMPRLSVKLMRNFLTIGIVSAIRHILVLGAELSISTTGSTTNHDAFLRELRTNIALVAVLLVGVLVFYSPWLVRAEKVERDEASKS